MSRLEFPVVFSVELYSEWSFLSVTSLFVQQYTLEQKLEKKQPRARNDITFHYYYNKTKQKHLPVHNK